MSALGVDGSSTADYSDCGDWVVFDLEPFCSATGDTFCWYETSRDFCSVSFGYHLWPEFVSGTGVR